MNNPTYDIAAYIWPSYTGDEPRSRIFWPEGIGEWQSVKNAVSKFDGHNWPRKPLWGYVNEADPYVMEMQINAAADHGVNVFIYDWYWYDHAPFLENCLNDGYLKAKNNDRVKFYLMWANHTVNSLWDIRNSHNDDIYIWDGAADRREFEVIAGRLIEKYFSHPSYYRIDGKPVFMLFELANLVRGLGGAEKAREALDWFRGQCEKAGLGGLHLQYNAMKEKITNPISGELYSPTEIADLLGFDSFTNYQYAQIIDVDRDYNDILTDVLKKWEIYDKDYKIPYFPHVTLGWDNNPRFKEFKPPVVKNNTPENVKKAYEMAKKYADEHSGQPPLITVNSWNEWTETSYLQPDDLYGYGYLEALKDVFLK